MNKDRNTLRQGVSSILGSAARRASALDQDGESTGVVLTSHGGRPPAGSGLGWDRKRNKMTSVVFDAEQHRELRILSNKLGITFKQLMFELLREGHSRYHAGELEIKNPNAEII